MYIKALMKGASKVSPTIKSVKPSKNIKEFTKHKEDIAKSTEKFGKGLTEEGKINVRKGTSRVLGKISNILKRKQLREKKMGGGMMGRRMNYKKGSKFPDLTGDGKVTFADILKGRGVINGKKKKKGEIFLTKKKSKNKNV